MSEGYNNTAESEFLDVPFGSATFLHTTKPSSNSVAPIIEPPTTNPPSHVTSSSSSPSQRSSKHRQRRRRSSRRRSSSSSLEDDDYESLLLAKRTDKLIADFQEYVCEIEQGNNDDNNIANSSSGDDHNIKHDDDVGSLENVLLSKSSQEYSQPPPQDPPECRSPSSLSQRRSTITNTTYSRQHQYNIRQYQYNIRRSRREVSSSSSSVDDEESCCSKERGLSYSSSCCAVAATLRSKARACSNDRLGPNVLMLACAVIGSLVAITLGATRQSKATTDHHPIAHTTFIKNSKLQSSEDQPPRSESLDITKLNWFNRPEWSGQTYSEALEFCSSHNQVLCPYSSICPHGPGSKPINGGFVGDPVNGLAWVATSDDGGSNNNSWAQVGSKDYCLKYEFMHGGRGPDWGISGEDNEEITRHVACCPPPHPPSNANGQDSISMKSNGDLTDEATSAASDTSHKIPTLQDFDPVWYTHSDGWNGSTSFEAALDFCLTKDRRSPCPYEAYCPEGPHHPPTSILGGPSTKEGMMQSWSPVINEIGRGIVQVGGSSPYEEDTTLCKIQYLHDSDENNFEGRKKKEEASVTNKGLESLITHIMCCHLMDREKH